MKAGKVKGLDPHESLIENAARIVTTRLAELRSFAPAALAPGAETEQHDMRIAAKRLRYVLETVEFCFGAPAERARRKAKALTEVLGELHDCDVMLPRVEAHIEALRSEDAEAVRELAGEAADLDAALSARAPHRTAYRGLEVLAVHLQARRALLFDRFTELWEEIERIGVWRRLERAIDSSVAAARERQAAALRARRAEEALADAERARIEAEERARQAASELERAREARMPERGRPNRADAPVRGDDSAEGATASPSPESPGTP